MMEDKTAVRKIRQNKLKFKNRSKKDSIPDKENTKKKSAVENVLPSNWSKYEIPQSPNEEYAEAANFETLLQEPISHKSNFKFKSEQSWSSNVELQSQFSKYFTVDLKLLSEGVMCVPFTKRYGIDENLFPASVLETFNNNAKTNLVNYEKFLNTRYARKNDTEQDKTTQTESKITNVIKIVPVCKKHDVPSVSNIESTRGNTEILRQESKNAEEDELDSLLHLKITEQTHSNSPDLIDEDPILEALPTIKIATIINSSANLEQWLDDILDD